LVLKEENISMEVEMDVGFRNKTIIPDNKKGGRGCKFHLSVF
jgi:hypothetical protein